MTNLPLIDIIIIGAKGRMGQSIAQSMPKHMRVRGKFDREPDFPNMVHPISELEEWYSRYRLECNHPSEPNRIIAIEFTHPDSVKGNVELLTHLGIPFVSGTTLGKTGLKPSDISRIVTEHPNGPAAVYATNYAQPIASFLQFLKEYSDKNEGLFDNNDFVTHYPLELIESHQRLNPFVNGEKGKVDPSGTFMTAIPYFQKMGVLADAAKMHCIHTPYAQRELFGIPLNHIQGHAAHIYSLFAHGKSTGMNDLGTELMRLFDANKEEWGLEVSQKGRSDPQRLDRDRQEFRSTYTSASEDFMFEVYYAKMNTSSERKLQPFISNELAIKHIVLGRGPYMRGIANRVDKVAQLHYDQGVRRTVIGALD